MMNLIWQFTEDKARDFEGREKIFLLGSVLFCALIGLCAGACIVGITGIGAQWLICFAGYPAVFAGFIGGILYIYSK